MTEDAASFWSSLWAGVLGTSALEWLAVLLGLAYLLLAIRQSQWCWWCAFVSTAIFTILFWDASLLMESALNGYYLLMAVYGWWRWRGSRSGSDTVPIVTWTWQQHLGVVLAILALSVFSGYLLEQHTQAAMPYLDSFTTWGAVITTYMVARKVLENWLYWLVIDGAAVYLYLGRDLHLTALLMMLYLVLALAGLRQWWRDYQQQMQPTPAAVALL